MTFALGTYTGPALALVGETALLRIELGVVVAAKFCAIETGLGFVWRRFEGGTFAVPRKREPAPAEACNGVVSLDRYQLADDSSGGNGRGGFFYPSRAVRELSGPDDRNNEAAAA